VGINIPRGQKEILLAKISKLPLEERLHIKVHRVRTGETLAVIARRYGSPISLIQRLNRLQSIHRIRAGARLLIPTRKGRERRTVAMRTNSQKTSQQTLAKVDYQDGAKGGDIVHQVKKGESLWTISQRYGVQISDIFRWNLLKNHRIRPGDELVLRTGEI
jgi:membrane-bound lytic murein transglycosylase D